MSRDATLICRHCLQKAQETDDYDGDYLYFVPFYYSSVEELEEMPPINLEEMNAWIEKHKEHGDIGLDIS